MKKAKWIWLNDKEFADEYVQFCDSFAYNGGKVKINISCDTNYVLSLNGKVVSFGQYFTYPDTRVYDTIELDEYVVKGKNILKIEVWYWGVPAMVYCVGKAGLLYETEIDDNVVAYSGENTLSRLANDYESGHCKYVNIQQGLSYCYNPNNADGFFDVDYEPKGFLKSKVFDLKSKLLPRPNKKLITCPTVKAKLIDCKNRIYDLGKEYAGILHIRYTAPINEKFLVVFGEYIKEDGNLLRFYDDHHDYSVSYVGTGEAVEHIAYMKRIGCRYLQVISDNVEIDFIGLKETVYPLEEKKVSATDSLIRRIYDVCIRTLRLCMHEHYEDCPWREQTLYSMDSRNAMLCTYEAFGDTEFARSNLLLMNGVDGKNGFYPASFPSGNGTWSIIPIFNLVYIIECREYLDYSCDFDTLRILFPRLKSILSNFQSRLNNGLLNDIKECWNFVEWTQNMEGLDKNKQTRTSLALTCFYILAIESYSVICKALNEPDCFKKGVDEIRQSVFNNFFDREKDAFTSFIGEKHYCDLCNALAVLSGCAFDKKQIIIEKLADGQFQKSSLSMRCFIYDALLSVGDKYFKKIKNDILVDYEYMLNNGATSFWETINGEKEYDGAGSLCHVWSATPIIYLKKIGEIKEF